MMGELLTERLGVWAACATAAVPIMFGLGYLHTEWPVIPAAGYLPIFVSLVLLEQINNIVRGPGPLERDR